MQLEKDRLKLVIKFHKKLGRTFKGNYFWYRTYVVDERLKDILLQLGFYVFPYREIGKGKGKGISNKILAMCPDIVEDMGGNKFSIELDQNFKSIYEDEMKKDKFSNAKNDKEVDVIKP